MKYCFLNRSGKSLTPEELAVIATVLYEENENISSGLHVRAKGARRKASWKYVVWCPRLEMYKLKDGLTYNKELTYVYIDEL